LLFFFCYNSKKKVVRAGSSDKENRNGCFCNEAEADKRLAQEGTPLTPDVGRMTKQRLEISVSHKGS
jgi:hypothetical protein